MASNSYRLYGDLMLPDPSTYLNGDELARLSTLEPFFRDLEAPRSLRNDKAQTSGYADSFAAFAEKESALWEPARPANHLVPPSGLLESPIAHHLHNPSFYTLHPHDGETADDSNLCIWLVMQNGFKKGQTLIFDHLSRRDIVDGIKLYPKEILKCHEDFIDEIRSKMLAEVEVVWGKDLWGEYEDVTVYLEWEVSPTIGEHTSRRLVRFITFVIHPQFFMYPSGRKQARWQDLHLTVAGRLARVEMIEDFYQKVPPASKKDFLSQKVYANVKVLEKQSLEEVNAATGNKKLFDMLASHTILRQSDPARRPRVRQSQRTSSRPLGDAAKGTLSTSQLKEILAKELDALSTDDLLLWNEDFDQLPAGIRQWLDNHTDLWFNGIPVTSFEELVPIYQQFRLNRAIPPSLVHTAGSTVVLALMETHAECLGRGKPLKIENETYSPIVGPFSRMDVECSSCGAPLPSDRNARWVIADPPRYLVKATQHVCTTTKQVSRKRYAVPRDKSVHFQFDGSNSRNAKNPSTIKSKKWQEMFVRNGDQLDGLPKVVDTHCESCLSKLKDSNVLDDIITVQDAAPLWTVQDPPRYIMHRRTCRVCKTDWKFLPANRQIPYIPMKTLRDLEKSYRDVADSVVINFLSSRYKAEPWLHKISLSVPENKS
ncbi:hypothetical protein LTR10_021069 [Elasticomyces elasticus]|uniref:Uncharacterized protein n=1 Tax=Exophiala sideris TaxID=1016849 RepID=A0ABR0JA35_9EURO|nr:hypothetical protein LTR10_021069 [Elasticomyces elasticus]KAK5027789.1 hypothetical protein LTS07_006664 [Exophiala sideris]KAK5037623.1 hypothetical protein LTR13_004782 [Exophiala sideris]KAK5059285.1 hypothetical protein LTR69_006575 [Exophiala sideris]KAK5183119.1 hypothetical protein LTR44_004830 [Eurotiomycetes sp. CCFEE 6388]